MITVTLPDGSSYAACDELEMGSPARGDDSEEEVPVEVGSADGLVLVMRNVKVRKGMKGHLVELKEDDAAERDVVAHLPNRTVRINGLQVDRRTRDQTRFTFAGYEVVA